MWTKVRNLRKVYKWFFLEEKDLDHVKYKYRIISKLVFIEVLWESSHSHTLIKDEL